MSPPPEFSRQLLRSVAVVVAALTLAFVLASCSGAAISPGRPLQVRGNLIERGGVRFLARGAVDYVLPFYSGAGGGADLTLKSATEANYADRAAAFRTMRSDGVNLVRIPLGLPGWTSDIYGLGGQKAYLRRLVSVVRAAESAGLVVDLCWFDSLGWGSDLPDRYRRAWPMERAVIEAVGRDPDVVYEPFNEPNGLSWGQWSQVIQGTLTEWRRVFGYRGVLILDTIDYSWTFSASAASQVQKFDARLLGSAPQVVFANHRYPNGASCFCGRQVSNFQQTIGQWVGRYPLIGGEYGVYVAGFVPNPDWMAQFLPTIRRLDSNGLNGAILFVWRWVDANSLTKAEGSTLSAYGRIVRSELWSAPSG